MLKFVVMKNGKVVGEPFDAREEAEQIAELEKLDDPSADVRVQPYPVVTVGEELDPAEGQALVEAILEGEDFSDLPPEHRGPTDSSDEGQVEAPPEAVSEQDDPGQGEKTMKNDKGKKAVPMTNSFFVRQSLIPLRDEDLEKLWTQDKIAVHLPGFGGGSEGPTPGNHQKPWEKMASIRFKGLATKGGYVWVETRVKPGFAKVGRVVPQEPEPLRVIWGNSKNPKYAGKAGSEVVLMSLRMEDVKEVAPDQAMGLRAQKPPLGVLLPWTGCGSRLKALIEGSPVERTWGNLTPRQQRAVSAEFLRLHRKPGYPKLKFLLAPSGIAVDEVDVHGLEEDGTAIYAQIIPNRMGSPGANWKVKKLKKFARPGNRLVCFCRTSETDGGGTRSLFPPAPAQEDGVLFIPVEEVLRWLETQSTYADRLFSA